MTQSSGNDIAPFRAGHVSATMRDFIAAGLTVTALVASCWLVKPMAQEMFENVKHVTAQNMAAFPTPFVPN